LTKNRRDFTAEFFWGAMVMYKIISVEGIDVGFPWMIWNGLAEGPRYF
jgi:hypothetical protein